MKKLATLIALLLLAALAAPALPQDPGRRGREGRDGRSAWERMKRHDANGDGRVTAEEFRGPDQMFDRLDRDGAGVVTQEEAEEFDRKRSGGGRGDGERGSAGRSSGQSHDWVFRRLDLDRNDRFDGKDLEILEKRADENGDGVVDRTEFTDFLTAVSRDLPRGRAPEEGNAAPDFELTSLDGERTITLAGLLGEKKPVVLIFGSFT